MRRFVRIVLKVVAVLVIVLLAGFVFLLVRIRIPKPKVDARIVPTAYVRKQVGKDFYRVNNCWLRRNEYGVWEMYLEGEPYERGVIYGVLAKELIEKQEEVFVKQITEIIPNSFYRFGLKMFVGWFNRDIYKYIPEENLEEIYGIAQSFSDRFDFIGPKYYRILNYHAAHDIGHALNDFQLVGCTSFAVNKEYSADSSLLLGRNFDFYMGDDFAKEKLLLFMNPSHGFKYASYSWAGFTGVVSGMNEKGVSVTINASKSDIPFESKEPISILAREILQYSKNISEAVAIASKRETFVSESILVGSAEDDEAVLIEKSPKKFDVYRSGKNYLVCANHYQGESFAKDSSTINSKDSSDSNRRFKRMTELVLEDSPMDYRKAAEILRDKNGEGGKEIGLGNSASLNQLMALHATIFKPKELKMWISTGPYQIGKFICYDLNKVFHSKDTLGVADSLTIAEDAFVYTDAYRNYEKNKKMRERMVKFSKFGVPFTMSDKDVVDFVNENPDSYVTYLALGDYFKKRKQYAEAKGYYEKALQHEVASKKEVKELQDKIALCNKKMGK